MQYHHDPSKIGIIVIYISLDENETILVFVIFLYDP